MNDNAAMEIVLQVGEMHFEGNIIPQSWFEHLKYPSGKPYLTAIMLLSEIVYWFRPREIRDERTGRPISFEKKFKGDALQRSYESFANQFGFTKREATDAIKYLVSEGIIRTELRTVTFENRFKFPNVMFITVVPERLREITHGRRQSYAPFGRKISSAETGEVVRSNGIPSSAETEDTVRRAGIPSSALPDEEVRRPGGYDDDGAEDLPRQDVATSRRETEPPPAPKRETNTENNIESRREKAREIYGTSPASQGASAADAPTGARPPAEMFRHEDDALPRAAQGEPGRRRYPRTVELARWCRRTLGRPLYPADASAEQLVHFEEALDRLDAVARACGQTAEEVITTRIWLRPEVQAQLREATWPSTVISRQVAFALEDYSARAMRQKDYAPAAPRRRGREKPEWMSDEEWAFHEGEER